MGQSSKTKPLSLREKNEPLSPWGHKERTLLYGAQNLHPEGICALFPPNLAYSESEVCLFLANTLEKMSSLIVYWLPPPPTIPSPPSPPSPQLWFVKFWLPRGTRVKLFSQYNTLHCDYRSLSSEPQVPTYCTSAWAIGPLPESRVDRGSPFLEQKPS